MTVPVCCTSVTGPMRAIMAGAALGSSAVLAGEGLAVCDDEQVGAEGGDLVQQAGRGGRGEAEDGHDGGHADGDAQGGEPGSQLAGAQPDRGEAAEVRRVAASSLRGSRSWSWLGLRRREPDSP